MTPNEVPAELKTLVVERLRLDRRRAVEMTLEATRPTGVEGSLGLDSPAFIERSGAIEECFAIVIDESRDLTDELVSLESLASFIFAKAGPGVTIR